MEGQSEEHRRKTANMKDTVEVAHSLKRKWGGHVARTEQRR